MTWYWWNHWFWITGLAVIFLLTFNNCVSSYPISPLDEIKEYNNKNLPLKYPINSPDDDHDIDDVYMGQENIPSPQLLKIIEENKNYNQLNIENKKIDENLENHKNKTIEDNLILNKNQTNNNNNKNNDYNSNLNNISNVIKLVPDSTNLSDKLKKNNDNINVSDNINQTVAETENINIKNNNFSNFSIISTNINKTLNSIHLNESTDSSQSNIMQIKKNYNNINSTISLPPLLQTFDDNNDSTTIIIDINTPNYDDNDDEISNITKLDLVTTIINNITTNINNLLLNENTTESTEKISTKLENITKMFNNSNNGNIEIEYIRKSKILSSVYRDGSRSINFPTETKNLLTRSASSDLQLFAEQHEDANVSSEALQITGVMDAGTISGICFAVFALCVGVSMFGIILYRRRFLNKPQTLNEPDSSVYIDDSTIRDNSDEMYSLDNDSFLNSLEAMTIQNYWTDTVKHTKL